MERYKKKHKWKLVDGNSTVLGRCSSPEDVAAIILEVLKNPKRKKHDDWAEERDSWIFYVKELVKEETLL